MRYGGREFQAGKNECMRKGSTADWRGVGSRRRAQRSGRQEAFQGHLKTVGFTLSKMGTL